MDLTKNLDGIKPDPIRYWVKECKDAGATNMFTIGVPDKIPKDILETFAKAAYDKELEGITGYPPFVGEAGLKEAIIDMEGRFGATLSPTDTDNMYVTIGASQALQFFFSLFQQGSEILVNTPCWGTIFNMVAHSGNKGVPVGLFESGKFVKENADAATTEKTKAVYINYPANPTAEVMGPKELKRMCEWAVSKDLQIVTDEPYKYVIFDNDKTPYESPVSFGQEINENVSLISSFSKIIKPDIRLGFIRVSKIIMDSHKMVGFFFRNLSAGATRSVQAGVEAVIRQDPSLPFLKDVVAGYEKKSELVQKMLTEWGCELPYKPAGTYMIFPTTHDGSDSEDWVKKIAAERKCGFVPGTSFGGAFDGFGHLRSHFRMGFGAGMEYENLEKVLSDLTR